MFITLVQLTLNLGSLVIMLYALMRFLKKPQESIEERIKALEVEVDAIKATIKQDDKRFEYQFDTNEVIINSLLALIEFEIQYCITEDKKPTKALEDAKEKLNAFLSRRK
jgi:hypothetical protein